MAGPRDFIRRAERNSRSQPMEAGMRMPAPIPMTAEKTMSEAGNIPMPETQMPLRENHAAMPGNDGGKDARMQTVAQNVGGHSLYRELMRSHDRMGTRHIGR